MQVVAGLETTLQVSGVAKAAVIVCFTPGGRVYVVHGADVGTARDLLPTAAPFTGDVIFEVFRKPGGVQHGLSRQVIMTANGATRLHSR